MDNISINRSSMSIQIPLKNQHLLICGYSLRRIEFHGINDIPLFDFWNELKNIANLVTLIVNKENVILLVGKLIDNENSPRYSLIPLKNSVSKSLHKLPRDIEIDEISGYSLPVFSSNYYKIISNALKEKNSQIINKYLFIKKLTILGHCSNLVELLMEKKFLSLILSTDNLSKSYSFRITIRINTTKLLTLEKKIKDLQNNLSQLPNIHGELVNPGKKFLESNQIRIQMGLNKNSINSRLFAKILNAIPKTLPVFKYKIPFSPLPIVKHCDYKEKLSSETLTSSNLLNNRLDKFNGVKDFFTNIGSKILNIEKNSKLYILNLEIDSFIFWVLYILEDISKISTIRNIARNYGEQYVLIIYENKILNNEIKEFELDAIHADEFLLIKNDLLVDF